MGVAKGRLNTYLENEGDLRRIPKGTKYPKTYSRVEGLGLEGRVDTKHPASP